MAAAASLDELALKFVGPDEVVTAQRDRALDLLEQLLLVVDPTQFAWPSVQESLHAANALLAELGRGEPDRFAAANAAWLSAQERG